MMNKNKPEISRISPFMVHETVQIFGENVRNCAVFAWQATDDNDTYEESFQNVYELEVTAAHEQMLCAKAVNSGVTFIWLKDHATGAESVKVIANLPEIWNQSMDVALPGERIQLYGQNLMLESITTEGKDKHRRDGSKAGVPKGVFTSLETGKEYNAIWGLSNDQDMPNQVRHKADIIIPPNIPFGEYELRLHNGTGGVYGYSKAVRIVVKQCYTLVEQRAKAWNHYGVQTHSEVLNVDNIVSVQAPQNGDIQDSSEEIQRAIDVVYKKGGGIVLLSPGRFGIKATLKLMPGVVLRGSGKESTIISVQYGKNLENVWPPMTSAKRKGTDSRWAYGFEKVFKEKMNHSPMIWILTNAGIEDMCICAGAGVGCICAVGNTNENPSENVFLNNIKAEYISNPYLLVDAEWLPQYHGIVVLSRTRGFSVWNCCIKAPMPLDMLPSHHYKAYIVGNTFETIPRQGTINTFIGSLYYSVIAENTFIHGKRSLMSQMGFSNNWIFQNRSYGVGRATNGQEEYMSEFGDSSWFGNATKIEENCLYIPELSGDYPLVYGGIIKENLNEIPHYIYVASGKGLGQYRKIKSIQEGVVTLSEKFDILPDIGSVLVLINITVNNLWVNNSSENGGGLNQFIFGAGIDNIIAGHEMLMSGGISLWAFPFTCDENGKLIKYGVIGFNQIINTVNRFSSNQNAGIILWSKSGRSKDYSGQPLTIIGNIIRGNIVVGTAEGLLMKNQTFRYWMMQEQPWLNYNPENVAGIEVNGDYNLVEHNLISGIPNGVFKRGAYDGNEICDNRFEYISNCCVKEK